MEWCLAERRGCTRLEARRVAWPLVQSLVSVPGSPCLAAAAAHHQPLHRLHQRFPLPACRKDRGHSEGESALKENAGRERTEIWLSYGAGYNMWKCLSDICAESITSWQPK